MPALFTLSDLIKSAQILYDRSLDNWTKSNDLAVVMISSNHAPWREGLELAKGLALKTYIRSIKKVYLGDGKKISSQVVVYKVDPKTIEAQTLDFINNPPLALQANLVFYKEPNGRFIFNGIKEMVPNRKEADYWKFWNILYDLAMTTLPDQNHYYHIPYNILKTSIEAAGITQGENEVKEKIKNFPKNYFNKHPEIFGLRGLGVRVKGKLVIKNVEIIKPDGNYGLLLYNPPIFR